MMIEGVIQFKPELRFTPNGKQVVNFDIINSSGIYRIEAWESLAEIIAGDEFYDKMIPRSTTVRCYGRWRNREYKSKIYRYFTLYQIPDIVATN